LTDPSGTQFNYNQIAAATTSNTFTWTLTAPTSGSHTLYSKAFYAGPAGVTFTQGLIFTVGGGGGGVQSNTSVTITTPIAGISAVGTVDINTNIVNLAGISYAILRIDGTIVSNLTATPFIWSWNTSQYADGLHTINITAAGADGTFGYAQQTLTVANTASMSLDQNAWQWTILALLMSSIAVIAAVMVLILMMKKRRMGGDV
jgi:ABC-type glucose/galactose transport system permease subunit